MQFLNRRVSVPGILYIFNIFQSMQVPQHNCCLDGNSTPTFLLGNNENYAFVDIIWSVFDVSLPDFERCKEGRKK